MRYFVCVAAGLLSFLPPALAYGPAGHETVGTLAAHYLQGTRAERESREFLHPDEDLGRACTWADRAKLPEKYLTDEMKDFVANNPAHHRYHYCDLPFQEKAYRLGLTGTDPHDIVQMMKLCIGILQNPDPAPENPTKLSKRVALLLLTHYVGDLHQPLHVGCSYVDAENKFVNPETGAKGQGDAGGNNFKLTSSTALHGFWDTAAVKIGRSKAPTPDFSAYLLEKVPPQEDWKATGPAITWPEQWATDVLGVSKQCYEGITIFDRHTVPANEKYPAHDEWKVKFDAAYGEKAGEIVTVELAKAGWRLAELFKAIWPDEKVDP